MLEALLIAEHDRFLAFVVAQAEQDLGISTGPGEGTTPRGIPSGKDDEGSGPSGKGSGSGSGTTGGGPGPQA